MRVVEAAFKNQAKAAELSILASPNASATIWQIDSQLAKVRSNLAEEEVAKLQAARALLDRQDSTLADLQSRAAQKGINITFEVQSVLWDDNPRVLSATTPGPLRRRHWPSLSH